MVNAYGLLYVLSAVYYVFRVSRSSQVGHDNWIRAIIFHPAGKHIISAADDNTYRIWEIKTGRCVKRIEAHERFVSCIAWGRQALSTHDGDTKPDATVARVVNVIATGSSDQVCASPIPYYSSQLYLL